MARRINHDDYAVGWGVGLADRACGGTGMLDKHHHDLPQNTDDANTYTLRRIGVHNVVLAWLPAGQTGTNSAAAVAMQMKVHLLRDSIWTHG
jgi:hypothetical protein